ncbi:hypothetical protein HPG69_003282, partial [Diceros bicornis minor]
HSPQKLRVRNGHAAQRRAGTICAGTTAPGRRCAERPVRRRASHQNLLSPQPGPGPSSGLEPPTRRGRVPLKRETAAARARWAPVLLPFSGPAHEAGEGAGAVGLRAGGGTQQALVPMAASLADASRTRREKRRQLDARRSKCRIRLGGHMEQWCLLKEQLGFSLHSQLAKFLLDRYTSSVCVLCAGPEPLPPKGLQYLVLLSHAHSRECSLVPGLRGPGGRDGGLVWECSAGHTFSWGPSSGPTHPEEPKPVLLPSTAPRSWCPEARGRQEPAGRLGERRVTLELHLSSSLQPRIPSPLTLPVPTGLESEHDERTQEARLPRGVGPPPETFLPPGEEEGKEEDEDEEEMLSDASPWTYSSSPDEQPDAPRPPPSLVTHELKEGETSPAPAAPPVPFAAPSSSASSLGYGAPLPAEVGVQLELSRTPQAAQQTQPLASPGSQAQSALASTWDEDTVQIGPKRIRKAAKRELLPCDFPGCGRIFSNRQYLNVRGTGWVLCGRWGWGEGLKEKLRQRSLGCGEIRSQEERDWGTSRACLQLIISQMTEPACGKSFNFKKHLKEHVKLHSGEWWKCLLTSSLWVPSLSPVSPFTSLPVGPFTFPCRPHHFLCEICGFTCRQKASLNWHRRKHAETAATLRFPCEFCGKCFEKPDSVAAHCSKSHPALHPAPQESPGLLEPCPSISAPAPLGSGDGSRLSPVPQAPTLLPQH